MHDSAAGGARKDVGTHCEVEAQVPVGRGVQVGGAHSPPALLLKDQRRARLDLSALCPEHSAIDVPAEERKKAERGRFGSKQTL